MCECVLVSVFGFLSLSLFLCVYVSACLNVCVQLQFMWVFAVCLSLFLFISHSLFNHTLPTGIIVLYTLLLIISHGEVYVQFTWRHHPHIWQYDRVSHTHARFIVCLCLFGTCRMIYWMNGIESARERANSWRAGWRECEYQWDWTEDWTSKNDLRKSWISWRSNHYNKLWPFS